MELHELKEALSQVDPGNAHQIFLAMSHGATPNIEPSSVAWRKLFAFYNSTGRRMGMGCRSCYKAVYDFVDFHVKKEYFKNA